jgi:hypothetical protein
MENRKYVIFNVTELNQIDFSQVSETGIDTVRKSLDNSLTFVKYDGDEMPSSVESLLTKVGIYNHEEILTILSNTEWTDPNLDLYTK